MRIFLYGALCALAFMWLTGCVAPGVVDAGRETAREIAAAEDSEERRVLASIAREDLAEALRSAELHDDAIAAACWRGLLALLDRAGDESYFTEVKGAFSAYQKARNIRRLLTDTPDEITLACSALRRDATSALVGIARTVGLPVPGIF